MTGGTRIGVALLVAATLGCGAAGEQPASDDPAPAGERVSIVGMARNAKLGALVETEGGVVWIDGLDSWPDQFADRQVRVEGVSTVRSDLPAFVHKPGELQRTGIPVSSLAEVEAARRRTVLTDATWELVSE